MIEDMAKIILTIILIHAPKIRAHKRRCQKLLDFVNFIFYLLCLFPCLREKARFRITIKFYVLKIINLISFADSSKMAPTYGLQNRLRT